MSPVTSGDWITAYALLASPLFAVLLMAGYGFAATRIRRHRIAQSAARTRPLYDPEPPERMPVAPDARRRAVQAADTHDTARDQQEGARP